MLTRRSSEGNYSRTDQSWRHFPPQASTRKSNSIKSYYISYYKLCALVWAAQEPASWAQRWAVLLLRWRFYFCAAFCDNTWARPIDLCDRNKNGGEARTDLSEFPQPFDTNLKSNRNIHEGTDLPSVWVYQLCLQINATCADFPNFTLLASNKILALHIRITWWRY